MRRFFLVSVGVYLFTRLVLLLLLPPFHDEVVYIWLSKQFGLHPIENWAVGFIDGKEPFFFWVMGLFQVLIPEPLIAGRVMSVVAGLFGLGIFYRLSQKFLSSRGVMIALAAYIISPFLLLYQRLALIEGLLTTLLIWAMYRLICFLDRPTFSSALLLGLSFALPAITKTNSLLFLGCMVPLVLYKRFPNWKLSMVAVGTFLLSAGWLYLLPQYQLIATKNHVFTISVSELLSSPLTLFKSYLRLVYSWLTSYLGLTQMLSVGFLYFTKRKEKYLAILLLFASVGPLLVEMSIAKQFFPRYFLFSLIPFLLVFALALQTIKQKILLVAMLFIVFIPQVLLAKEIIVDPANSSLHPTEKWQFIYSWPAGYGWQETATFLKESSPKKVVIEEIWGALYSLRYYNPNASYELTVHNYNAGTKEQLQSFVESMSDTNTYFIFTQLQTPPAEWGLSQVKTFPRPGGVESISIWQKKQ